MRWSLEDLAKARSAGSKEYTPDPTLNKTGNAIMQMADQGEIGQKSGMVGTAIKKGIVGKVVKVFFGA
jgi:hypothetical protein